MLSSHQATISDARRLKKSGSYNSEQSWSGNIKKAHKQMKENFKQTGLYETNAERVKRESKLENL